MKASERRLLSVFVVLAVLLGTVLGGQKIYAWQRRIDQSENGLQLRQLEARTLMQEAPMWTAMGNWLAQVQPVAESDLQANEGLLNHLQNSAESAGLTASKTQIEPTDKTSPFYRQFGVSLAVKGDFPTVMRWVHGLLSPEAFYVVPQMRITPDKDEPEKVVAQVKVWRWYRPEIAAVKEEVPAAPVDPAIPADPANAPGLPAPEVPAPEAPAPATPAPEAPAPVAPTPVDPAPVAPTPEVPAKEGSV